jgi:hypothetical protein
MGWTRARKGMLAAAAVTVVLAAAVLWARWTNLRVWYDVRGLAGAQPGERDRWVERVARLDASAVPALLRTLRRDDARACDNVRAALVGLLDRWGPEDGRADALATAVAAEFPGYSAPGQRSVLEMEAECLASARGRTPAPVLARAVGLLRQAPVDVGTASFGATLDLAAELLVQERSAGLVQICRALALRGFADTDPDIRLRALRLGLHPRVALTHQAAALLADPAPEVRRAAMLLVGTTPAAITPEQLMGWLHDSDAEVRQLCEQALASQGVRPAHIRLARLKTDPDPRKRLEVLDCLPYMTGLDPAVWVRSLSEDPVPAVRAAAVRAAVELSLVDMGDRVRQMAQTDPAPTLRQICKYYLTCHRPSVPARVAP